MSLTWYTCTHVLVLFNNHKVLPYKPPLLFYRVGLLRVHSGICGHKTGPRLHAWWILPICNDIKYELSLFSLWSLTDSDYTYYRNVLGILHGDSHEWQKANATVIYLVFWLLKKKPKTNRYIGAIPRQNLRVTSVTLYENEKLQCLPRVLWWWGWRER